MMTMAIAAVAVLATHCAHARDLGVIGPVYAITEPSMIEVIQSKLRDRVDSHPVVRAVAARGHNHCPTRAQSLLQQAIFFDRRLNQRRGCVDSLRKSVVINMEMRIASVVWNFQSRGLRARRVWHDNILCGFAGVAHAANLYDMFFLSFSLKASALMISVCWPSVGAAKGSGPGVRSKRTERLSARY